jgi:hypothetical protein
MRGRSFWKRPIFTTACLRSCKLALHTSNSIHRAKSSPKSNPVITLNMNTITTQSLAVRFGKSKRVVAVADFREASQAWEKLRDENDLGASESPKITVINTDSGKTIATISYNGCVWGMDGKEIAL